MSDNSPVPEWFGRTEEERRAAKSARARGLGCGLLVVFALVSSVAIYFAIDTRARAERLERDLAAARQREKDARDEMQRRSAAAEPTPVPAPEPVAEPPVEPPPDEAPLDGPADAGSELDSRSVQRVLRTLSPEFRKCYNAALAEDPSAEGRLRLDVRIAPSGDVESVQATREGNLSPAVGHCVAAKLRAAKFPASGRRTSVSLPVVFKASN